MTPKHECINESKIMRISNIERCMIEISEWKNNHEDAAKQRQQEINLMKEIQSEIRGDIKVIKDQLSNTSKNIDLYSVNLGEYKKEVDAKERELDRKKNQYLLRGITIIFSLIVFLIGFSYSWGDIKGKVIANELDIKDIKKIIHQ